VSKRKYHPLPVTPATPETSQTPIDEDTMFTPPIVAEASTDVDAAENVTVLAPPIDLEPAELPAPVAELPVVVPEIDWRSRRISVGKLIAKHLRIPPACAQEQAAGLTEWQLNAIMETQLSNDPADAIRQILQ
jgi:hypothetical protein